MAILAITGGDVKFNSAAPLSRVVLGEACDAGEVVYKKSADSKYWKAQCDGTAEEADVAGILTNGGTADQTTAIQSAKSIVVGGTPVVGTDYFLSQTPGKMCLRTDLAATNRIVRIAQGAAAASLNLDIKNYGQVVP